MYYGWFIVAAGLAIMAVGWGGVYNCSGLFLQPVGDDLGFTRSQISATMTIRALVHMLAAFLAGRIYRRFDMLRLMKVASLVLVTSFFTYSLATTLFQFYLISAVSSLALSLVAVVPLSIILSNWFVENQGTAMGLAFMGSGVGGMILNAVTGYWISAYGWRPAYQMLAIVMGLVLLPAVFVVIRIHPRDLGLTAPGAESMHPGTGETEGMLLAQALRRPRFWILAVASICLLIGINGLMLNISPHLTDLGYSIRFAANVTALTMGSLALGKVALGRLFDRLGVRRTVIIADIAVSLSMVGLLYARYVPALALVVVCTGVGCAYATVANPVLTLELFGRRDYNAIFGFLSAIAALGSVIQPLIYGWVYDLTGSYTASFQLSLILALAALPAFWLILLRPAAQIHLSKP